MPKLAALTTSKVLAIAAISGGIAVILGAFGAHALRAELEPNYMRVFQTAVQYHFYHTLALAIVALAMRVYGSSLWLRVSALLFIVGLIIFSGSLYVLAVTGLSWLGMLTPLGGLAFIGAWVCMAAAAIRDKAQK